MAKFEITWLEDRSDDAILEEIRRVAALVPNRRLTRAEFDSLSKIKSTAVSKRFGSWSDATRRAGLASARPVYSDAAIIEDLKRVADSSQYEPFTIAFYLERGKYSSSHIKRQFGGWREALDVAEIGNRFVGPPTTERMKSQPGRAMSDEEILTRIREVAAQLGKTSLAGADVEANSEITLNLMYRRFGSVSAALRQAGVEQVSHGRRYTEDEVFENLLNVWTYYGRTPTALEMDLPPSTAGKNTYIHRYGGWRKALKAFVERASSEADTDRTLNPEQKPSKAPDRPNPAKSPTPAIAGTRNPRTANQVGARARVTRPTPASFTPAKRQRSPTIGLRFRVLQHDKFKCVLCGDHPAQNAACVLHVDHIFPFSKGGETIYENLQTLCAHCNIGKSNRST